MIVLVEQTRLSVAPMTLWNWFRELDEHYPAWSREHLTWRTLRGEPLTDGAIVFFDEWIGWARFSGRAFICDVDAGRHFAYRNGLPGSLIRAGGSFSIEPISDGACELTQVVHLGFAFPLLGGLIDRLLAFVLPLDELRRHMAEEHETLRALLSRQGS